MNLSVSYDEGHAQPFRDLLTDHYGPETNGSWKVTHYGKWIRIILPCGDLYVGPGDTLHVKNTSVLVSKEFKA